MPPDPPSLFTPQWPYHSKIAGSSSVQCFTIVCLEAQNLRGKDRPLLANIQTMQGKTTRGRLGVCQDKLWDALVSLA